MPITTTAVLEIVRRVPLAAWLGLALALSLLGNLHQYGEGKAAAEKARADCLQGTLDAKAAQKKEQDEKQDDINQTASVEADTTAERLADIASSTEGALANLRRQYADALTRNALHNCRVPALRLRSVNAPLARPRPD
jgi:rubrerythrin